MADEKLDQGHTSQTEAAPAASEITEDATAAETATAPDNAAADFTGKAYRIIEPTGFGDTVRSLDAGKSA